MMKSLLILATVGLVCLIGCGNNIFSWSHKTGSDTDTSSLLFEADSYFSSGDYAKATEYYGKVITADSKNSIARYGYAKAYAKNMGISILSFLNLVGIFSQNTLIQSTINKSNPFADTLTKFENVTKTTVDYLDPIALGKCDEKISKTDSSINLELCLAYLLRTIFVLIDPPNGTGGTMQYNFSNWENKSWDITLLNPSIIPSYLPNVVLAITYLDASAARLDTAITYSLDTDSKNGTEIKNFIKTMRNEISSLNLTF